MACAPFWKDVVRPSPASGRFYRRLSFDKRPRFCQSCRWYRFLRQQRSERSIWWIL
jgi:hypothetical protein